MLWKTLMFRSLSIWLWTVGEEHPAENWLEVMSLQRWSFPSAEMMKPPTYAFYVHVIYRWENERSSSLSSKLKTLSSADFRYLRESRISKRMDWSSNGLNSFHLASDDGSSYGLIWTSYILMPVMAFSFRSNWHPLCLEIPIIISLLFYFLFNFMSIK